MPDTHHRKTWAASLIVLLCLAGPLLAYETPLDQKDFSREQRKAWSQWEHPWFQEAYFPCLKKRHLQLTCAGLSSLFWKVQMRIDPQGNLTEHRVTESSKPWVKSESQLQECVIEYFRARPFPEALRNLWIEVRLGTGLSC